MLGRSALGSAALAGSSVAAEALSRRLVSRLATSRRWFDNVVDYKARQLAHLVRSGRRPNVVVAGHSMTFDACEPKRVEAGLASGTSVYNAGVNLAPLGLLRDWVTYVVEVAKPPVMIIGLTTVDLNANGIEQAELLERHRASVMGRRSGRPDWSAPEFKPLAAVELAQSAPRILRRLASGRTLGLEKAQYLIGPDGRDFHKTAATYRCSPRFQDRFRQKWLVDFDVGPAQVQSVREMFARTMEAGVAVALFIPPFTDDYVSLHPRCEKDVRWVTDIYHDIGVSVGCPVFEAPRAEFATSDFADPIHLNDKGMAKCSDWLGRQIKDQLRLGDLEARLRMVS